MTPPNCAAEETSVLLWTPRQVCSALACRRSWLYDEVQAGRFPVVRLGRQLRFRPADITSYLERHTRQAAAPPAPLPARAPRRRRRAVLAGNPRT